MTDVALSKIAGLIKSEEDLVKISQLRLQFVKEKASVDSKLSTMSQLQIDSIMTNLSKLNSAAVKLNTIKANINKVNQVHDDSITKIKDYSAISTMTTVNQFLGQVEALYHDIAGFKAYLQHLNTKTERELNTMKSDLGYPLPNIFEIHFLLNQARNFADFLQLDSLRLSDDLKSIVYKIVSPLRASVKLFDELLAEAITSLTEAVKDGNTALAYKVVKIIEFENSEDLKFALMQQLGLGSKDTRTIAYETFRNSRRGYKKFFNDKLEESLIETFQQCVEHFSHDKMLVYDNLDWLEDELRFVSETFAGLFPAQWGISTFIQNVYHEQLHKFTMSIIKTDPPAEDLLRILSYDLHYTKLVGSLDDKKKVPSIIGEDLKGEVLEDYLKIITTKMDEWNTNLMNQEKRVFTTRNDGTAPHSYNYHQVFEDYINDQELAMLEIDAMVYVLPDFKIPLTMLKEQADVSADLGYSKILVGVIEHWAKVYNERTENYRIIIEDEFERYMLCFNNEQFLVHQSMMKRIFRKKDKNLEPIDVENMTNDELQAISPQGLIEYLIALANTYEINTDRLQDKFLPTYKDKTHPLYHGRIERAFEDTLGPSTEIISQVVRYVVDIIVNDLYPALSSTFTKSWYEDKAPRGGDDVRDSQRIVETIGEYMSEIRMYASYDIYQVTFNVLLDTFILSYLKIGYTNILQGDAKKIDATAVKKYKSFSEAINRDISLFYSSLEGLLTAKDREYLYSSLNALEFCGVMATMDNPLEFIPHMWENEVLPMFYYCSVEFVRGICYCRKDLEKAEVNNMVDKLVKIQRDYHVNNEPPQIPVGTLTDFSFT